MPYGLPRGGSGGWQAQVGGSGADRPAGYPTHAAQACGSGDQPGDALQSHLYATEGSPTSSATRRRALGRVVMAGMPLTTPGTHTCWGGCRAGEGFKRELRSCDMACDELSSARESGRAQGGTSGPTPVRPVLPLLRQRSNAFCVLLPVVGQHALPGLSRSPPF